MQSPIPQGLVDRLDRHLKLVRAGTSSDDDILPAVFALLLEQQRELERNTSTSAVKVASALKAIEELAMQQSAMDMRLEVMQSEIVKRAKVALSFQVFSFIVVIGAIAFLMLRH